VPGRRPKFTAITRTACLDFSNLQPTSQTCTHLLPTTCEALQRCSTACTPPELRLNVDSTAASRPTKLSKPTIQETQTALLRHDWPKVRNARGCNYLGLAAFAKQRYTQVRVPTQELPHSLWRQRVARLLLLLLLMLLLLHKGSSYREQIV
jgi:hypothetical protein